MKRRIAVLLTVAVLGGCASAPKPEPPIKPPASGSAPSRPGYYLDDGPGDNTPANLDTIPEPVPRAEPLHRFANRPYVVFGREYVPATSLRPYRERGVASWYGRKFHGQKTSTGETYDMISFKLYDAQKVDKVELNGKVKDLSNNQWSDVNFIKPPTFGAVKGLNTLVVFDVAGNTQTYTFTLN